MDDRIRELRERGLTLREVAQQVGRSHEYVRRHAPPSSQRRRSAVGRVYRFGMTTEQAHAVREVARRLGLVIDAGSWVGHGSIGQLLEAIARGEVLVRDVASGEIMRRLPGLTEPGVKSSLAPWVLARVDRTARRLGIFVDANDPLGPQRRVGVLLRGIADGIVDARWRHGAGPDQAPRDYREAEGDGSDL